MEKYLDKSKCYEFDFELMQQILDFSTGTVKVTEKFSPVLPYSNENI